MVQTAAQCVRNVQIDVVTLLGLQGDAAAFEIVVAEEFIDIGQATSAFVRQFSLPMGRETIGARCAEAEEAQLVLLADEFFLQIAGTHRTAYL